MNCWAPDCNRPATEARAMGTDYYACSWACAVGWVIWRLQQGGA